jgi:hypothetical protein
MMNFVGVPGQLPPKVCMLMGLSMLSVCSPITGSPTLSGSIWEPIASLADMVTIRLNNNKNEGGKKAYQDKYFCPTYFDEYKSKILNTFMSSMPFI